MNKRVQTVNKRVSRRRSSFNFAPAPKQEEKSLEREVFEFLLEAVSPDTLKVRRFTESLAISPKLSKQAQSFWGNVGMIVDIVGFIKLLNAVAPEESKPQARQPYR